MIQDVPAHILVKIFHYLPKEVESGTLESVCKAWQEIVQQHFYTINYGSLSSSFYESLANELMSRVIGGISKEFINQLAFGGRPKAGKNRQNNTVYKKNCVDNRHVSEKYHISSIIKCGVDQDYLKINIHTSDSLHKLLREIKGIEPTFDPEQTRYLEVHLIDSIKLTNQRGSSASTPLRMGELIDQVGFALQSLIIQDSSNSLKKQCLDIRLGKLRQSKACFLETVKIISPNSTMTRVCLEYLISSCFGSLDYLHLHLKLEESIKGSRDDIWIRVKSFCLQRLKKYNIFFREGSDGTQIFSLSNFESEI